MTTNFKDISILVVGYDGYKDVWDHFFTLLNKNWTNRPTTYLASSEIIPDYENVIAIPAGKDSEWSKRALAGLSRINTPYTLLLLEDFFISEPVDNEKFDHILTLIKQYKIKFYQICVQLYKQKWAKGESFNGYKHLHIIPFGKKYPINLQAAIWETDYLRDCIGSGNYNAWQFEINHINDVNYNLGKVDSLIDESNPLNIIHGIVQSKYLRGALKQLKKAGYEINCDNSVRSTLSIKDNFNYNLKLIMYSFTPKFLEKTFKKVGRMMKIDFVTDRINKKN